MIRLEPHAEGVILPVRASPGSRQSGIRGEQEGELKVCVTQIAEKGKANKALLETLATALRLRKSQIELLSGETSHHKRFLVRDISLEELRARIEEQMEG
jgi:uncharacterized protein (TIGR00251 family)